MWRIGGANNGIAHTFESGTIMIFKYRNEGKTLQEIADLVGCSYGWVREVLRTSKNENSS